LSRGSFLFGLWCLFVAGTFVVAGIYGYSPFAQGGRAAARAGAYGPTHK
jgi:hypothetical protein